MPIVSTVEARTLKGRLIHAAVIAVLLLTGSTMVFPFLIMVSGSLRSEIDQAALTLVPAYLTDDAALYAKFLESKYNQDLGSLIEAHGRPYYSFAQVHPPEVAAATSAINDLHAFLAADLPRHWLRLGGVHGYETVPENLRTLRLRLRERFDDDLAAFSGDIGMPTSRWLDVVLPPLDWASPRFELTDDAVDAVYAELLDEAPLAERQMVSLSGAFAQTVLYPRYGGETTAAYNAAHAQPLASWEDSALPRSLDAIGDPVLRDEWVAYVRNGLSVGFVALREPDDADYREFLRERYGDVASLAAAWGRPIGSFDEATLPQGRWVQGGERLDYRSFLATQPDEALVLAGPEFAYRDALRERYGDIASLNAAYGTGYAAFDNVPVPMAALEFAYVIEHAGALRWRFAVRNYVNVFDELVLQGRALVNTVAYVALCVGLALIINPLAAYAISRFRLPGTYKVLLLLMATTAFPPMVTLIPQFIMLRELHLLNTLAALVLPFMVNGYMVFLLKGFFDSLPAELYEAGRIDGASEARMFVQITMALSKPILAVLGLQTFTAAYTAFLYPLLVAPDPDMWLISVWLYQFQQRSSGSAVYASVLLASVPTLVVFLFAQLTIMRGIVVPTEK